MPPVRFRIRTIMIVIALVAVLMGLLPLSVFLCVLFTVAVFFVGLVVQILIGAVASRLVDTLVQTRCPESELSGEPEGA